mgnify:CR=1 FL=1
MKQKYYYIGADGKRYLCQLHIFEDDGEKIFSFLSEHSGDRLNIKKIDGQWIYSGGSQFYMEDWIVQLGEQVDSGKFV